MRQDIGLRLMFMRVPSSLFAKVLDTGEILRNKGGWEKAIIEQDAGYDKSENGRGDKVSYDELKIDDE